MDELIRTSSDAWKNRFWLVAIILILIVLFFIGRYALIRYNEYHAKQVVDEVAIYQTETGNMILWNGTERISFLFKQGGFTIRDNQIVSNEQTN